MADMKAGIAKVEKELEKSRKLVEREAAKMKKAVEGSVKKADAYMKKNPEKSAAIAAGVAAALGAAAALVISRAHGKKKDAKK